MIYIIQSFVVLTRTHVIEDNCPGLLAIDALNKIGQVLRYVRYCREYQGTYLDIWYTLCTV